MRKGILLALLLVMVLVFGSMGFAATTHTVTVNIARLRGFPLLVPLQ